MKRYAAIIALAVLLAGSSSFLAGCGETIHGMGEDINRIGKGAHTVIFRD